MSDIVPPERRFKDVQITGDPKTNRDAGKLFRIIEMDASHAERWAHRALIAILHGTEDSQLPEAVAMGGSAAMAIVGLRGLARIDPDVSIQLLDEMFDRCVRIVPDPKNKAIVRECMEEDIQEVITRIQLRVEAFDLNLGFLKPAALSSFPGLAGFLKRMADSPNALTSPAPSTQS